MKEDAQADLHEYVLDMLGQLAGLAMSSGDQELATSIAAAQVVGVRRNPHTSPEA